MQQQQQQQRSRRQSSPPAISGAVAGAHGDEFEVFVLTARAYDLGVPVMSALCTIRIYPPKSKEHAVTFIVVGSDPDIRQTEESLSAITGGRVIIHSVKPYSGNEPGAKNVMVSGDARDK